MPARLERRADPPGSSLNRRTAGPMPSYLRFSVLYGPYFGPILGAKVVNMLPRLVPVTDMKRQAAKVLDALRQDRSPMVITEHGRAAAVLLDIATYEALTRRSEILDGIEQGERDFAEGNTSSWEDVKSDLAKWRT